jgi:hypothetical protein
MLVAHYTSIIIVRTTVVIVCTDPDLRRTSYGLGLISGVGDARSLSPRFQPPAAEAMQSHPMNGSSTEISRTRHRLSMASTNGVDLLELIVCKYLTVGENAIISYFAYWCIRTVRSDSSQIFGLVARCTCL